MPALDHLVANMRVVILERSLAGPPTQLRGNHVATAVFVNFCRLTDKALLEYEAARADFDSYVSGAGSPLPYLRGIDHMENCIDATYRAVRHGEGLRFTQNRTRGTGADPRYNEMGSNKYVMQSNTLKIGYSRTATGHAGRTSIQARHSRYSPPTPEWSSANTRSATGN